MLLSVKTTDMDIKVILKSYGLIDAEVALYLAALTLGESPLSVTAKKAGIKRSTAYAIAKSLEEKGLLGSFRMRDGLRFVPTSPQILLALAQKRFSDISAAVPSLEAMARREPSKPHITYYEGSEGYIVAAENSLKISPGSVIRYIGSLTEAYKVVGMEYDTQQYIPARIKRRISFRGLCFASETPKEIKSDPTGFREIRFLPEAYVHHASSLIYEDTVAIFSSQKELITISIESQQIAEAERQKFDLLWKLVEGL